METEPEYKKLVDLVSKENLNFEFPNSSIDHAKYVISKIIDTSKKEVNIFSKSLDNPILNSLDVIDTIKGKKDIQINILLENPNQSIVKKFKDAIKSKNLKVRELKNGLEELSYFIVADNKKVRICSREETHKGRVNFFDKKRGEILNKSFNGAWEKAKNIAS
jgi:hypothetical protein